MLKRLLSLFTPGSRISPEEEQRQRMEAGILALRESIERYLAADIVERFEKTALTPEFYRARMEHYLKEQHEGLNRRQKDFKWPAERLMEEHAWLDTLLEPQMERYLERWNASPMGAATALLNARIPKI